MDLEKRIEQLEKRIAAIERIGIVRLNLNAKQAEDEVNAQVQGKQVRPQADKAVRAREDK